MLLRQPGCAGGGLGATAVPGEQQQAPVRDGGAWGALANAREQVGSDRVSRNATLVAGVRWRWLESNSSSRGETVVRGVHWRMLGSNGSKWGATG
jgi:hypothetical protein